MNEIWGFLIRTSAFLGKEIFEVLRQPRLLLTLVLGPFLILLIFGIGYRNEPRALRTLFVISANSPIEEQIEEYAQTLGPQLVYQGTTTDSDAAFQQLRVGNVDLVVVAPPRAYDTIRRSEQAVFNLYHREIDPFQVDYVNYFGQVYTDEVNRRVVQAIAAEGQQDASTVQEEITTARQHATAMREAMESGNLLAARQQQIELTDNLDNVSLAVGASLGLLSGVEQTLGGGGGGDAGDILASLNSLQGDLDQISVGNEMEPTQEEVDSARRVEENLQGLESQLEQFTEISPHIIVQPFRSEAESIAEVEPSPLDFFAPAVVSLLLQHLAITFAALSIVRERNVGTLELFQVSPLSAGETLFGKYLSYMFFGVLITAALTLLLYFGLAVPMLGSWWNYALVVLGLLFTSISIGFVISLLSQTDSQAVQYTMLVLLTSVFFSGFIMDLSLLWEPVRAISWALPTTYGIVMLRDIMLRGLQPDMLLVAALYAIGVALMVVAWLLLRRMLTPR